MLFLTLPHFLLAPCLSSPLQFFSIRSSTRGSNSAYGDRLKYQYHGMMPEIHFFFSTKLIFALAFNSSLLHLVKFSFIIIISPPGENFYLEIERLILKLNCSLITVCHNYRCDFSGVSLRVQCLFKSGVPCLCFHRCSLAK